MEIISKISKGSVMDQVYIPKNRQGFPIGSYVVIKPLETEKPIESAKKPYFYNVKMLEPVKLGIIHEIFKVLDKAIGNYDNIIITGSFLEKGFSFNDIDILIIKKGYISADRIADILRNSIGINAHLIFLDANALLKGLSMDPLYQMMLSKCVSKKRFLYKIKHNIDYKILDIHLLKSKGLIDNFDELKGSDKYYMTRNMIAIMLYLKSRRINKEHVDSTIRKVFKLKDINEIRQNMLNKGNYLKTYKSIYSKIFNNLMEQIKHGSK